MGQKVTIAWLAVNGQRHSSSLTLIQGLLSLDLMG